jgi:hypothetical protein
MGGAQYLIFSPLLHEMQGGRSVSSINVKYVLIMNGTKKKKFCFQRPKTKNKSNMIEMFFTF